MSNPKHPWPDWQLTAYLLGESQPELAEQIKSAAESDPELAAELNSLRQTIDSVSAHFQRESAAELLTHTGHQLVKEACSQPVSLAQQNCSLPTAPTSDFTEKTSSRNRLVWVGVLALAATLLVAIFLSVPTTTSWVLTLRSANSQHKTNGADQVSSRSSELTTSPENQSISVDDSNSTSIVSTDSLVAEKGLFGDVKIEFVEEHGLQNIGRKQNYKDVERTLNVIEQLKQSEGGLAQLKSEKPQSGGNQGLSTRLADGIDSSSRRLNPKYDRGFGTEQGAKGGAAVGMSGMMGGGMDGIPAPTSGTAPAVSGGMSVPRLMPESESIAAPASVPGLKSNESPAPNSSAVDGLGLDAGAAPGDDRPVDRSLAVPDPGAVTAPGTADAAFGGGYRLEGVKDGFDAEARSSSRAKGRNWLYRGESSDRYASIVENSFVPVSAEPLSTFSIDVDTASYAKTRQFLKQLHQLPPVNAVRIEELINYFEYEYTGPKGEDPFGADLAVADCPWKEGHQLVRIALQAKKIEVAERPKANIVFLLDVSGSMDEPNKLPLVKDAMRMLVEQLGENDRIAIVVYAGAAGCVLDSITGDHQATILGALDRLNAGGSTNGGQGIQLAYDLARDHFIPGGINRVILCTDGDFNVGVTSTGALVDMVATNAKSKIFLTVLGFGMGNTNDAMMEQISNKGNGVYGFVDSRQEAKRHMVQQLAGTLMTVAKDVKIQVEFNPAKVKSYRLIGYENRALATEDFNNDKKDAGEIGAGHRVTALYEIVPVTAQSKTALRYQPRETVREKADDNTHQELLVVNLRYKQPEGDESKLLTFPLQDRQLAFSDADRDFRWAASVAQFGMLLRHSQHAGISNWQTLIESAESAAGVQPDAARAECLEMIEIAARLAGR